ARARGQKMRPDFHPTGAGAGGEREVYQRRRGLVALRRPVMSAENTFEALIRRVRGGDQEAAAELVRLYQPAIRRAVRVRLVDERLHRLLDSMAVCQSVLASFFMRAALGQFDLEKPEQLLKLLATMARNKLASAARKERTQGRDNRRVEAAGIDA